MSWQIAWMVVLCFALVGVLNLNVRLILPIGILLAVCISVLFVRFPKVWILSEFVAAVALNGVGNIGGVDVVEGVLTGYVVGGIVLWMSWHFVIRRQRLVSGKNEEMFLLFFGALVLNVLLAWANGTSIFGSWIREALYYLIMLYFFPLRYHLSIAELERFYTLYILGLFYYVFDTFRQLQQSLSNALYAYQMLNSSLRGTSNSNGVVFIATLLTMIFQKRKWVQLVMGLLSLVVLTAVGISLARTLFLAIAVSIALAGWVMTSRAGKTLLVYVTLISATFIALPLLTSNRTVQLVKGLLVQRFLTVSTGNKDRALRDRANQLQSVEREIALYWAGGAGLRARHSYYELSKKKTIVIEYVHFGYYGLIYHFGTVVTVLITATTFTFIIIGLRLRRSYPVEHLHCLAFSVAFLCFYLVFNITETSFGSRQFVFPFAIAVSFITHPSVARKKSTANFIEGDSQVSHLEINS